MTGSPSQRSSAIVSTSRRRRRIGCGHCVRIRARVSAPRVSRQANELSYMTVGGILPSCRPTKAVQCLGAECDGAAHWPNEPCRRPTSASTQGRRAGRRRGAECGGLDSLTRSKKLTRSIKKLTIPPSVWKVKMNSSAVCPFKVTQERPPRDARLFLRRRSSGSRHPRSLTTHLCGAEGLCTCSL